MTSITKIDYNRLVNSTMFPCTHRALWYDARSEPKFWAVDPTEGPLRTRQRLQKAKLGLNPSLVNRAGQYKLGKLNFPVSTSSVG